MTFAQLQAFVAVIESGSFTTASEVLGITQSAVSHALASLETELGVTLVQRDRAGLALTDVGQRVILQAREMLARAENIRQEAAAARGLETGKLRLGSLPSISARFLPGALRMFRQRYPKVDIVLLEGTDQEVRAWIDARMVDVGVVTLPTEGVDVTPIAHDEFLVIVPEAHPLAKHSLLRIEALAREPFLLCTGGCGPLIQALFDKANMRFQVQLEVREIAAVLAMVQEGMGITMIPEMALPSQFPTGIRALHLRPAAWRHLALAVPSRQTTSPATQMFLQQAQQWGLSQGFLREDDELEKLR
ncbi:LysR family transcriptional regulator [Ktedonosporobacter rubrisoli]|uniref:LysR family transcriptional regulator n=1 Tax=Ktedonosporobacter rubrisoli TaxID=2509675 RepID=A0A4P6JWW5_KTERU|nr:LysR family transcriptional regulator [Ktedonosporobacter rubrisoli]QBD79516.1 LysR family transcriptional regulator [Ktedonosporobacter rubrisoli]